MVTLNTSEQKNENNNNININKTNKINENITEIKNITLKNQAIKIQSAFRDFKKRVNTTTNNQTLSRYTNDFNFTETGTTKMEFLGKRDSHGLKQGFGIQKMREGSRIKGIFLDDRLNSWGIFEYRDGDIYRGEFDNNRICGYGEYSHENGAVYYGYWIDDMQFGIGYEIWGDTSQYSGEYNDGRNEGIGTFLWQNKNIYIGEWKDNKI